MSEYQIVKFRAADRPLTDKQLEYMDRQSSRAEATKWEFEVEYHYSSFNRTASQLLEVCESLRQEEDAKQRREDAAKKKRQAQKAEQLRQARISQMKAAPDNWLTKATALVEERGTENYREAAAILADLRDAVGGTKGTQIARKHAAHLIRMHPTLHRLKSFLRKQLLLD